MATDSTTVSETVQNLLEKSKEVTDLAEDLLKAVQKKDLKEVQEAHELLERAGGNINSITHSQQTVIHMACFKDYYNQDVLQYLMNTAEADLHLQDGLGWTPVHYAAYSECEGALNDLLEQAKKIGSSNVGFTDATAKMTKAHMSVDKWELHQKDLSDQTPKGLAENAGKENGVLFMGRILAQLPELRREESRAKAEAAKATEAKTMLAQYKVRSSISSSATSTSSQLHSDLGLATTAAAGVTGTDERPASRKATVTASKAIM